MFPLVPGLVMFNHASYGLATNKLLDETASIRRELESDPNVNLGERLQTRLNAVCAASASALGLSNSGQFALTMSATSGAAALQRSIPMQLGDTVVILSSEYSSVIRGWQQRCADVGADLHVVDVRLPVADVGDIFEQMTKAVVGHVAVLQISAISSSAALQLPVNEFASWGRERGAAVIVDAAHVPFHVAADQWCGVDAVFGTMHKWLPLPRSVGMLWTSDPLASTIRPAEASLSFDSDTLAGRFGWPGTFDPAARLVLPSAIETYREWATAGALDHSEMVADYATAALEDIGAISTAAAPFRPPRLRAFLVPGVEVKMLRNRLLEADIRAWTGAYDQSTCLLRIATNVYNDDRDVDALVSAVRPLIGTLGRSA
jgi:isopenicillin-N epimerase